MVFHISVVSDLIVGFGLGGRAVLDGVDGYFDFVRCELKETGLYVKWRVATPCPDPLSPKID